jgi:hypothetical protein
MQALVYEILQRIIHKAVALNAANSSKKGRGNAHPHVGAHAAVIGPNVAGVLRTFVDHTQLRGLQALDQACVDLFTQG